jgi:hypothetical protein
MSKPKTTKTHFEQVPLVIVKMIMAAGDQDEKATGVELTIELPEKK